MVIKKDERLTESFMRLLTREVMPNLHKNPLANIIYCITEPSVMLPKYDAICIN